MDRRELKAELIGAVLATLETTLQQRQQEGNSEASYSAALFSKGSNAILKKVGEEANEVILAAKDGNTDELISECADLLFHIQVLLTHNNISIEQVCQELKRRQGVSGIEEKRNRQKQ